MTRLNENTWTGDGPGGRPARGEWQWAELVSEVCECFERGAFADVTAAQAALDSASVYALDESLGEDEISLCLRHRWPSAVPAPVVFANRSGRPLRTEMLERRDALSATPGLHIASFDALAPRPEILPFVSVAVERPALFARQPATRADSQVSRERMRATLRSPGRFTVARAALHDVALAEFISAGELALTG